MITSREIIAAATCNISDSELRTLIDCELAGTEYKASEARLAIAADLLCDAALEVMSKYSEQPSITKVVTLNSETELELSEMAIYDSLHRSFREKNVTQDELQALLLRGSVASVIAQALEAGTSAEEIAAGTIRLASLRLTEMMKNPAKPKGLWGRLFGRANDL